jgi:lambda family phage portal protein
MEAELVAARIAACFALLVKTENNAYGAADARKSDTNSSGQQIESLEPGMIKYLNSGEEVTQVTPQRPGGSFEPFVDRILRAISASLNLPYEIVAKDFSKTNYSSARAALLEARQYFQMRQDWLARKFCAPVYSLVIEEAYLTGMLPISGFYKQPNAWSKSRWTAPGWKWVDPLKEAEASIKAINAGITTHAEIAAMQGNDWQEQIDQLAREEVYIKNLEVEKGITIRKSEKPATSTAGGEQNNQDQGGNNGQEN